uniref:Uncharacterized protein n=1 Tax=Megaselia scalaris TaxID=36166 RepID=T1GQM7_MEGSC
MALNVIQECRRRNVDCIKIRTWFFLELRKLFLNWIWLAKVF